jgi:pimeloyl-ACP methyl ester carboxylesterase
MNVLLLHGALGSSVQLELVRLALEGKGHTVYDLNFSGHGGEPYAEKFGIEEFAQEIQNFIVSSKLNNLTIFGYSMGGYAALWMTHQYPTLVQKVVTLGTKFDWSPEAAEKEIKKMDPEKIEQKIPAFARLLQARHAPNEWKELMSKTADMMNQLGDAPLLTEPILTQINTPVIIALGDADDMADCAYSERVAKLLPNAKFVLLSETPHPIEKVSVEMLVRLIV